MNIFGGMKILWIFFIFYFIFFFWGGGGYHKIGLYVGVISMHFRVFLKVKIQKRVYIWGLLKFQIHFRRV